MNTTLDHIAPEVVQSIVAQATARGLSVSDYLRQLLGLNNGTSAELPLSKSPAPRQQHNEAGSSKRTMAARAVTEWYGRLEDAQPFPDLDYWQAQSDAVKFEAAWEMVLEAHQIKGEDISESRLQRAVGGFQRRAG